MNKAQKKARFDAIGKRVGVSERIFQIARQITETNSAKRAVIGAGQIKALAEICEADSYWDEKMSYGYQVESDILNGSQKCTFDHSGSIKWDELVPLSNQNPTEETGK